MKLRILQFLTPFIIMILPLDGQENSSAVKEALENINQTVLRAQLEFLASDWMEGREAGTKGEYLASDYIASLLQVYGVKPGGDQIIRRFADLISVKEGRSFYQNFVIIKTSPGNDQAFKIMESSGTVNKTRSFTHNVDFFILNQDQDLEVEAPVIFAGYGFRNEKLKCDDFSRLDIKGKFILRISGYPGFARSQLTPSELSASAREAENYARSMGAAGIIEFNPQVSVVGELPQADFLNMSPAERNPARSGEWVHYSLPDGNVSQSFPRIIVSSVTAREILEGSEGKFDEYLNNSEKKYISSIPVVKGKTAIIRSSVIKEAVRVRNVIGIIEGRDPDQVMVLGAHYDHLGTAGGHIWNGADDNGSGTVGILTLAKALMETGLKPEKTIVIALWTAEEEGLLGSRYYVSNLTYPRKNLLMNFNMDMISRYTADNESGKVTMTYTESFPGFRKITEQNIKKYGIDLDIDFQPSKDPPGGSDHRSFVDAGIPVMRFKPGHREEYHTPADEVRVLNLDIMEKIVGISFANIWELANSTW